MKCIPHIYNPSLRSEEVTTDKLLTTDDESCNAEYIEVTMVHMIYTMACNLHESYITQTQHMDTR